MNVLRDLHIPYHLQTFLAFLLFLEQFLLAGDIAAVTFRQHILARCNVGAIMRPPAAAWMATSNSWRGISSLSLVIRR